MSGIAPAPVPAKEPWRPLFRVVFFSLLAALFVARAGQAAAQRADRTEGAIVFGLDLFFPTLPHWVTRLSSAWNKEGCWVDPNGRCIVTKTGLMIDPSGSAGTASSEAGCWINPDGHCDPGH